MEENQAEDVDVIESQMRIRALFIVFLLVFIYKFSYAQNTGTSNDSLKEYKKRVLEKTEVDVLSSYYTQNGENAAVTGGIGLEKLNDFATNIAVSIPLNDDDVLSIDGTISAYTSASSSNLNPFTGASSSGASRREREDDDDDYYGYYNRNSSSPGDVTGSPWVAASGASKGDVWTNLNIGYNHTSDNRNSIFGTHMSIANEFDYFSFGFGGQFSQLFNQKNTEISLKSTVYLDKWYPQFPTEIKEYFIFRGNLDVGFFNGVPILDQNGILTNKNGADGWRPVNTYLMDTYNRNTYSTSLSFSQILSRNAQFSLNLDIVKQQGWLANPMQRVYFADKANYYIGKASSIPYYTSTNNQDVFQLADDIERLPESRLKIPIGVRFHYYINENLVLRTYYRYYYDTWGIKAHTTSIELPIKISRRVTLSPSYRYYTQTAATYFAPFEQHLSSEKFYTSDYDLSEFNSNQYGLGLSYTDIFTTFHIGSLGLKTFDVRYNYYQRNIGFKAHIITIGAKFILN